MKKMSLVITTFLLIYLGNNALAIECNDNTDCAEGFECVVGTCVEKPLLEPEITLRQGGLEIVDGGSYNYGNTDLGTDVDILYTIENVGTANLDLTTTPKRGGLKATL